MEFFSRKTDFVQAFGKQFWQSRSSGVTDGREINALASSRDWVSVIFGFLVDCEYLEQVV